MAKGKNHEEDPEENKKNDFNEDDDFGLPDLEFNELEDDSEDFDDLNLDFQDLDEEQLMKDEETPAEDGNMLQELDSMSDIDFEKEVNEVEISDAELQKELEELENSGLNLTDEEIQAALDEPEFYEEESFEESEQEVEPAPVKVAERVKPSTSNPFDTKGTTKLSSDSSKQKPMDKSAYAQYNKQASSGNSFGRIVVIGVIVIAAVAFLLWKFSGIGQPDPEPVPVVKAEPKPEPKPEPVIEDPKPVARKPAAGTITALENRTGKSYIIVNSFIDSDLAQDYANKLAAQGRSPYLLAPSGNSRFYRVAIAEFATYEEANNSRGAFQEDFGTDVWTLRY